MPPTARITVPKAIPMFLIVRLAWGNAAHGSEVIKSAVVSATNLPLGPSSKKQNAARLKGGFPLSIAAAHCLSCHAGDDTCNCLFMRAACGPIAIRPINNKQSGCMRPNRNAPRRWRELNFCHCSGVLWAPRDAAGPSGSSSSEVSSTSQALPSSVVLLGILTRGCHQAKPPKFGSHDSKCYCKLLVTQTAAKCKHSESICSGSMFLAWSASNSLHIGMPTWGYEDWHGECTMWCCWGPPKIHSDPFEARGA